MNFLKAFFGGGKTHTATKQARAQLESAPTPGPPPAGNQGEVDESARALLAEVSLIERDDAQLLASTAALVQAGLGKVYEEVADPHGAFVLGYLDGCGHAVAKAATAGPISDVAFVLALFRKCLGEKQGAAAWAASTDCFHARQVDWRAGHDRGYTETSTLLAERTAPKQAPAQLETAPRPTFPADADSWFRLGLAEGLRGDFGGCIADLTKAIELKPDFAVAYFNRANAKQATGDLDGALSDYAKAIELKPDFPLAFFNRGEAKYSKGDLDGAIADHTRAIELQPDIDNGYCKRGNAKQAKGDLDGAIADYTQAIEQRPDDKAAHYNRGKAKQAKGDLDGAIADYTQAIELDPKCWPAYLNRGVAKKAKGDLDGANADEAKSNELKAGTPSSAIGKAPSCPECGAPDADRMEERGYQLTIRGALAGYACPGCKKERTFELEYRDKAIGINVLCGSCKTVTYFPPSVWCKTCGRGLSTGWQRQISTGREAEKVEREFTDPSVQRSRAMARELKAAHGKLTAIHFTSPDQDYEIDFDFADGKRICSGANSGDIAGLAFGYCGGGPNRLQVFLDEMGLSISADDIEKIKPGTTMKV